MVVLAWTDIPDSDIDSGSVVNEALVEKFWKNQEALISTPVEVRFAEVTGTTGVQATIEIYIPNRVNTTATVELVVRVSAWVVGGGSYKIGAQLDAGTVVYTADQTNSAEAVVEVRISNADLEASSNTDASLKISLERVSGGGTVHAKNDNSACRFERAA